MSRLIDADALEQYLSQCVFDEDTTFASWAIRHAPTVDAVRVVRCKDCSHSDVCKMDEGDVRYCHIFEMQTEDDYYCADGEMKDDETI